MIEFIRHKSATDLKLTENSKLQLINELEKTNSIRAFFQESLANATDELAHQTIMSERQKIKISIATFNGLLSKLDKYTVDKHSERLIAQNDEQVRKAA